MKTLENIRKNEKIVLGEASVTVSIILLFNTVTNALPNFWDSVWNALQIPNEIGQGLVVFVSNVITFAIVFALIHLIYKLLWSYVFHPRWNLKGTWYVIQRDNDKPKYFRVGEVRVKQNYFQINMDATTYNVIFDLTQKSFIKDESVRTEWEESLFLSNNDRLMGLYYAERTNGKPPRQGFHKLRLRSLSDSCNQNCDSKQRRKCRRKIGHIIGTLCDVEHDTKHDARIGDIELFRYYKKYEAEVVKRCEEICKRHDDVLDKDGKFRSEIQ